MEARTRRNEYPKYEAFVEISKESSEIVHSALRRIDKIQERVSYAFGIYLFATVFAALFSDFSIGPKLLYALSNFLSVMIAFGIVFMLVVQLLNSAGATLLEKLKATSRYHEPVLFERRNRAMQFMLGIKYPLLWNYESNLLNPEDITHFAESPVCQATASRPKIRRILKEGGMAHWYDGTHTRVLWHDPVLHRPLRRLPWPFSILQAHLICLDVHEGGSHKPWEIPFSNKVRKHEYEKSQVERAIDDFLQDSLPDDKVYIVSDQTRHTF